MVYLLGGECVDWLRSLSVSETLFKYKVRGTLLPVLALKCLVLWDRTCLRIESSDGFLAFNDRTDIVLVEVSFTIPMSIILKGLTASKDCATRTSHAQPISHNFMAVT